MSLSLIALILIIQFSLGIYKLRWGVGVFIFVFIVFPTDIPFLDFFSLNFVRASIVTAFFNVLIYHYTHKRIMVISKYKSYFYPILIFSLLILPSFTSAQFSEGPFRGIYLYFTYYFIEQFLPGILILFVLRNEFDFYYYAKWIAFSVLCMCLFGFYEFIIDRNPLLDWLRTVDTGTLIEYTDESRYGFTRRVQSTAWHPIAYGGYLSMYIMMLFVFIVQSYYLKHYRKTNLYFYLIILMALGNIVLTASRAPWLSTIITFALLLIINFKFFMRKYIVIKTIALVLITPILLFFVVKLLLYVATADVNGSSFSMRFDQFDYITSKMQNALYIGYGPTGIDNFFKTGQFGDALGFESIIFVYLVNYGLLGLIGLVILYYNSVKNVRGKFKSNYTNFFYLILVSHLVFVILSGELRTLRVFWLLYSMVYIATRNNITSKKNQEQQQNANPVLIV